MLSTEISRRAHAFISQAEEPLSSSSHQTITKLGAHSLSLPEIPPDALPPLSTRSPVVIQASLSPKASSAQEAASPKKKKGLLRTSSALTMPSSSAIKEESEQKEPLSDPPIRSKKDTVKIAVDPFLSKDEDTTPSAYLDTSSSGSEKESPPKSGSHVRFSTNPVVQTRSRSDTFKADPSTSYLLSQLRVLQEKYKQLAEQQEGLIERIVQLEQKKE